MTMVIKSEAPGASIGEAPLLLLLKLRTFIALFAVAIFFSFAAHNFLSIENLLIMSRHVALNAFLAIGMTFVIVAGGIDLSVGSIVGLTGMVAGGLMAGRQLAERGQFGPADVGRARAARMKGAA